MPVEILTGKIPPAWKPEASWRNSAGIFEVQLSVRKLETSWDTIDNHRTKEL